MKFYIGVTDSDWFNYLSSIKPDEVNFWKPGGGNFKAIDIGNLFLFKLKYPENCIVGGGYFFKNVSLPVSLAWKAFGEKNGASNFKKFSELIYNLRKTSYFQEPDPTIGCNILVSPFFFKKEDWIPAPSDWSPNIVQGKTYDTSTLIGKRIYNELYERLKNYVYDKESIIMEMDEMPRYGEPSLILPRLGQGAFRVIVTEAYERRCAITGEKTLPVLEASHIKPYSENGPHTLNNGLLLRSDLHTLYDRGYLAITNDNRVVVSNRIKEDYGNGREYYKLHGKELLILPQDYDERPAKEYIEWHNENIFLG